MTNTDDNTGLRDVVEVSIASGAVTGFMGQGKDERNADAIIRMAIYRRGVEESFYANVPAGKFQVGDVYTP